MIKYKSIKQMFKIGFVDKHIFMQKPLWLLLKKEQEELIKWRI